MLDGTSVCREGDPGDDRFFVDYFWGTIWFFKQHFISTQVVASFSTLVCLHQLANNIQQWKMFIAGMKITIIQRMFYLECCCFSEPVGCLATLTDLQLTSTAGPISGATNAPRDRYEQQRWCASTAHWDVSGAHASNGWRRVQNNGFRLSHRAKSAGTHVHSSGSNIPAY